MSKTPPHLEPSSARPFPVRARRDLIATEASYDGAAYWVVKDPVALEYYRLHVEQHFVLSMLDGRRSLEQIRAEFHRAFPLRRLTLNDLHALVSDFHKKGLVRSDRPGQGAALLEHRRDEDRQKRLGAIRNVFYIRLPGWDPERTLAALAPMFGWMFSPAGVAACVMFVLATWGLLAVRLADVDRALPAFHQFFGWPNVALLWVMLGVAKMAHELAHGLACRRFGGECHEIGVAFLVFSPCLYCDVSDSWMLPDKWKRIAIASAGVYLETLLSAVALLVWWWTRPGLLHYLALNAFFVSSLTTILFNLNPLLQFDGYYILADWLEIPNLRPKSDRLLTRTFARNCLGIELPEDPFMPASGRGWFAAYSAASGVYRWFLAFTLLFILHEMLTPYGLQNLGIGLGLVSVVVIVAGVVRTVVRIVSAPRARPMSRFRATVTLATFAAAAVAAACIPIPVRRDLPFVVEPRGVRHVYVSTPGRLGAARVRPGDRVRRGDVLLELESFAHEDHLARLKTSRDVQRVELSIQQVLENRPGIRIAEESLRGLEEQVRDAEEQAARLTVVAPCDGLVVAAADSGTNGQEPAEGLPSRRGTPLDHRNLGAWLDAGTHVLSIAPDSRFEAQVFIEQGTRDDVSDGEAVAVKLDHLPQRTSAGALGKIDDRHVEFVPQAVSNKFGGSLATRTVSDGRERLAESAFQSTLPLDDDPELMRSGLRGAARFTIGRRTAGDWLWRSVCETFHFRL